MAKYELTELGKTMVRRYIVECTAKRKEILDAGKDTGEETKLPTEEDILDDINYMFGLDDEGEYYNSWAVTDNYDSDYPLVLKFGEHLREKVMSSDELTDVIVGYLSTYHYDLECENTKRLIKEIHFRCDSLETENILFNVEACVNYARDFGLKTFLEEDDDCKIWDYAT